MRLVAATVFAVLLVASPALASQRWVAPAAQGLHDCSTQANACTIQTGISGAGMGDEVIITPGSYSVSTTLANSSPSLNVHGLAGAPRPTISSTASPALNLSADGDSLSDVSITDSAAGGVTVIVANAMTIEGVVASQTGSGTAFVTNGTLGYSTGSLIRDSVAEVSGPASGGVAVDAGVRTLTARNVTAYATAPGSVALSATTEGMSSMGSCVLVGSGGLTAENVIAHGAGEDVRTHVQGCDPGLFDAQITLDYSNYHTTSVIGGSIVDGGHNQTSAAQTDLRRPRRRNA